MAAVTAAPLSPDDDDEPLIVCGCRSKHPVERTPIELIRCHIGRHRRLKGPEANE